MKKYSHSKGPKEKKEIGDYVVVCRLPDGRVSLVARYSEANSAHAIAITVKGDFELYQEDEAGSVDRWVREAQRIMRRMANVQVLDYGMDPAGGYGLESHK